MGVHSVCISSTVNVPADKAKAALAALKKGVADLGFMDSRNIEFCGSLPEALEKLDFEFDVIDGDVNGIRFGGGKGDNSSFIMPILAPFIADGGKLVMAHDDEHEIWEFRDGDFDRYIDDEYDEYDDEDDISDEAYALFDKIRNRTFTEAELDSAVKAEGHANFRGERHNTVLIHFLDALTDGADSSPLVRTETSDSDRDTFRWIMKHSPDLNLVNHYGESALSIALHGGRFDLADELVNGGAEVFLGGADNPFGIAASRCSKDLIDWLTDKGHEFASHGGDALVRTCALHEYEQGKLEYAEYLVDELGADVNQPSADGFHAWTGELRAGATPLMAAATADDPELVMFLLDRGADPTATDSAGNTALHYCSGQTWYSGDGDMCWSAGKKNLDVVKLLGSNSKLIGAKNRSGSSPYSLARECNTKALAIFRDVLEKVGAPVPVELGDELNGEVSSRVDGQMGYVLNFKDGNLHGRQQFLNKNGNPFADIEYRDGKAHGDYKCWHDNGELLLDAACEDGKWHGEIKLMNKEGKVGQHLNYVSGRRDGRQRVFNDDGSTLIDATYVNGKKNGRFFFRKPDGEVLVDEEFVDDMPTKGDEEKSDEPKEKGLAGLFGALLGALSKELMAAEMAEDMLKPTDKLFFHKQDKVFALFEKMQSRVLEEA